MAQPPTLPEPPSDTTKASNNQHVWRTLTAKKVLENMPEIFLQRLDEVEDRLPVPTHFEIFHGEKPEKINKAGRIIYWLIIAFRDGLLTGDEYNRIFWRFVGR